MPLTAWLRPAIVAWLFVACHPQIGDAQALDRAVKGKSAYPKLESQLSQLVERAVDAPDTAGALAELAPLSDDGRVAVTIQVLGDVRGVQRYLRSVEIVPASVEGEVIEAYVPLLELPALGEQPDVARIEFIWPPTPQTRAVRPIRTHALTVAGLQAGAARRNICPISETLLEHERHRGLRAPAVLRVLRVLFLYDTEFGGESRCLTAPP